MSLEDYELGEQIGKGSYGIVYRARRLGDGRQVVIKQMPMRGQAQARAEARVIADLTHPGIVTYFDAFEVDKSQTLCLVMEYCDGGDLAALIRSHVRSSASRRRPGLPESTVLDFLAQMALALQYMHSLNVMHRDLKSPNVFLQDGRRRLKLGDFGVATSLNSSMDFAETCIGTPFYMSPELFTNTPYNFKSDIWALGCIVYEMLTGTHAFQADSISDLTDRVVKGRYVAPRVGSPNLLQLLKRMLSVDPNRRPTAAHILQSPLLQRPLRCVVDRYVAESEKSVRPDEMANLYTQLESLGLRDVLDSARGATSPERPLGEMERAEPGGAGHCQVLDIESVEEDEVLVVPEPPVQSSAPDVHVDEDGIEHQRDSDVVSDDGQRHHDISETGWVWTDRIQSDDDDDDLGEILPSNLELRKALLTSRCHDRIGEAKFGIVYEMLKSAPPESRPGTYSPGDDPSLADAVKQLVGNDWISLVDAIEQILWIETIQ